jgi:hypothetical protein
MSAAPWDTLTWNGSTVPRIPPAKTAGQHVHSNGAASFVGFTGTPIERPSIDPGFEEATEGEEVERR